jgi:hypothetical protein
MPKFYQRGTTLSSACHIIRVTRAMIHVSRSELNDGRRAALISSAQEVRIMTDEIIPARGDVA